MRVLFTMSVMLSVAGVCDAEEYFRCKNWLVSRATSINELLEKCGKPTHRKVTVEDVRAPNVTGGASIVGTTTKEVWTYDRGSQSLPMIVTIVDGVIESVSHTAE